MRSPDKSTDTELLALLKRDDHAAFRGIYNRYWKKLLHFAIQKTGDAMEAENLVQDVFAALWDRRMTLEISGELEHYLLVSVKYRVLRLFARRHRQRLYEESELKSGDLLDDSMQQYLDFNQLKERLGALIGSLPEKAQLIYRMNKESGMSHRQIAEELGMTEKAVNAQLVRTKKKLRIHLNSFLSGFLL